MPGDGAFYGPKLDFVLTDAMEENGNGTFQADFKYLMGYNEYVDNDVK